MTSLGPFFHWVALGATGAVVVADLGSRARLARALLLSAITALTLLLAARGGAIGFLPLTTKYESFLGFALVLLLVFYYRHARLSRPGRVLLAVTVLAALVATRYFDAALRYPSPLLYTTWYAVHVPASFAGYAFWLAAGVHALDGGLTAEELETRQDDDLRLGLVLFSVAMIFGAIWGLVSWGVYFLWDAKIVWSLAAWLYFATLLHLRFWPTRSKTPRAVLGALGYLVVGVTYVGTSFMSGSIHAF